MGDSVKYNLLLTLLCLTNLFSFVNISLGFYKRLVSFFIESEKLVKIPVQNRERAYWIFAPYKGGRIPHGIGASRYSDPCRSLFDYSDIEPLFKQAFEMDKIEVLKRSDTGSFPIKDHHLRGLKQGELSVISYKNLWTIVVRVEMEPIIVPAYPKIMPTPQDTPTLLLCHLSFMGRTLGVIPIRDIIELESSMYFIINESMFLDQFRKSLAKDESPIIKMESRVGVFSRNTIQLLELQALLAELIDDSPNEIPPVTLFRIHLFLRNVIPSVSNLYREAIHQHEESIRYLLTIPQEGLEEKDWQERILIKD